MEPRPRRLLLHGLITQSIIDSFFTVRRELGFGFREYLYALALERDLVRKGHKVQREVKVMVYFRGEPLSWQTIDMLVDEKVMVESKAPGRSPSVTTEQLFSYLTNTDFEVGLVLHYAWKPRFYRVFYENRFKVRSNRKPEMRPRDTCD